MVLAWLEIDEGAGIAVDGLEGGRHCDAAGHDFDHGPLVDSVIAHLLAHTEIDDNDSAFRLGKEHAWLRSPDRRHSRCLGAGLALVLLVRRRRERREMPPPHFDNPGVASSRCSANTETMLARRLPVPSTHSVSLSDVQFIAGRIIV
jgi:hypothetical protein